MHHTAFSPDNLRDTPPDTEGHMLIIGANINTSEEHIDAMIEERDATALLHDDSGRPSTLAAFVPSVELMNGNDAPTKKHSSCIRP